MSEKRTLQLMAWGFGSLITLIFVLDAVSMQ